VPQRTQILLRPGPVAFAGGGKSRLTAADLRAIRAGTLQLLARGWRIPVLPGHAAAGSVDGGPQSTPVRAVDRPAGDARHRKTAALGHLVDLVQLEDGSLAQVIELADAAVGARFTSPELRPQWTDPDGNIYGPHIAHVAVTDRPLGRGQTPLAPVNADHDFPSPDQGDPQMQGVQPMNEPRPHSDHDEPLAARQPDEAPPDETPPEGEAAEPGAPAPEYPETDAFPEEDTVLAEENADAEPTPAATPKAQPQTAEPSRVAERSHLAERIRASRKLPKGLRDRLSEIVETLQLSDDGDDVPRVPVAEAVEMIEAAIPEHVQFGEGPLEAPAHPRGENFFTGGDSQLSDDDAARIASEQLAATGFGPRPSS